MSDIDTALTNSGGVSYKFRYEIRSHAGVLKGDITPTILSCSITLDNEARFVRTATFSIDPENDENSLLTAHHDHIAVIMDLLIDGEYEPFDIGLFIVDSSTFEFNPTGETREADASDLTAHLEYAATSAPFEVSAGDNIVTIIENIIDDLSIGLQHNIVATTQVMAVDYVWAPATAWIDIINDLLYGIDYFPIYSNRSGVLISGPIPTWANQDPDIEYSTNDFIIPPFKRTPRLDNFYNEVVIVMDDPRRAGFFSKVLNNDPSSTVGKQANEGAIRQKITTSDFIIDQAMATTIATREVIDEHYRAIEGELITSIDPRRGAHEIYRINIPGIEDQTLWKVKSWTLEAKIGATMTHNLVRLDSIDTGLFLTETTDDI